MGIRDLGRKTRGVFFVLPDNPSDGQDNAANQADAPEANRPTGSPPVEGPITAEPNTNLVGKLMAELREEQGAAWRFIEAYESLDGVISDEAIRLKAALRTQKLTATEVAESYASSMKSLAATEQTYQVRHEQTEQTTQAEHSGVITGLEVRLQAQKDELQALLRRKNDEIAEQESKLKQQQALRDGALRKLADAYATFRASVDSIRKKLELASKFPKESE